MKDMGAPERSGAWCAAGSHAQNMPAPAGLGLSKRAGREGNYLVYIAAGNPARDSL